MLRQLMYNIFHNGIYPILHRPMLINTFNYKSNEEILSKVVNLVHSYRLGGDYLEFGVDKGQSFIAALNVCNYYPDLKSMNFYAFDSFQGHPPLSGVDAEGFQHFKQGKYCCSLTRFKKILAHKKVDTQRVTIVPGWYKDTLNEETKKKLPVKKPLQKMFYTL